MTDLVTEEIMLGNIFASEYSSFLAGIIMIKSDRINSPCSNSK
jgi:hypothetical protein